MKYTNLIVFFIIFLIIFSSFFSGAKIIDFKTKKSFFGISKPNQEDRFKSIAIGSYYINDSTIPELYQFIEDCNINNVIVDFGWVTWSWDNTKFEKVDRLINEIQIRNISIWLMYRARTLPGDGHSIPHQVHRNGLPDKREIRFSHKLSRDWAISWSDELLQRYPTVEGMIIYNPRFLTDCCYSFTSVIKFIIETKTIGLPRLFRVGKENYEKWIDWRCNEIAEFIDNWNQRIKNINSEIKTGIVVLSESKESRLIAQDLKSLDKYVDVLFPFVVLHNVENTNLAGDILNETKNNVSCEVVSDIKIYGPYENSVDDIVNAIRSSMQSEGDGFFIWDYDSLKSNDYDLSKIIDAYNDNF